MIIHYYHCDFQKLKMFTKVQNGTLGRKSNLQASTAVHQTRAIHFFGNTIITGVVN